MDPERVNEDWANTVVSELLTQTGDSPHAPGFGFAHFVMAVVRMRRANGGGAEARAKVVIAALQTLPVASEDSESEDEDDEGRWWCPVAVPEGAVPGESVLTVPLPGGAVIYAPVPEGIALDEGFAVAVPPDSVRAAVARSAQLHF